MEQLSVFQIRKMDQERLWLGLPLAMVPGDTLPSEKTVLRAFYGIFDNNMKKYRDNSEKIGCLLLKDTSNASLANFVTTRSFLLWEVTSKTSHPALSANLAVFTTHYHRC